MAGNLGVLNPFVFNQFNAYSPFTTVQPVSCRATSPPSPPNVFPATAASLSQIMLQQALLTSPASFVNATQTMAQIPSQAILTNSIGSPAVNSHNDFSAWIRGTSVSKAVCPSFTPSSMGLSGDRASNTPTTQSGNGSSSPVSDFPCNGQSDVYTGGCLSSLIQCKCCQNRFPENEKLTQHHAVYSSTSEWRESGDCCLSSPAHIPQPNLFPEPWVLWPLCPAGNMSNCIVKTHTHTHSVSHVHWAAVCSITGITDSNF